MPIATRFSQLSRLSLSMCRPASSHRSQADKTCLVVPSAFAPVEIKELRERHHVSEQVFARYPNTSESTVKKWEAGTKKPSGLDLKFLTVVQKHGLQVLA